MANVGLPNRLSTVCAVRIGFIGPIPEYYVLLTALVIIRIYFLL
jgi:hypothetical protein